MKKFFLISGLFALAAVLVLWACSNSSNSTNSQSTTRNYQATQTPGDVWSWTIIADDAGNGTFQATNETLARNYSGTVSPLPNKFLKLLVTTTTDTTITALPATAYALELPDTAILVKPAGSDSNVIVGVALGGCPTQPATYNMVEMTTSVTWSGATDAAYSLATTSISGPSIGVSLDKHLLSGATMTTTTETGFTCSNGRMSRMGSSMMFTIAPSGMVISDAGPSEGGTAGMQAPAVNINLADVMAAGREYRAVSFSKSGADHTQPHWARPNGSGGLTGGDYLNFEAGTEDPATTSTITFGSQATPGVVNASFAEPHGTTTAVFMINQISGKYFIYGIKDNLNGIPELFLAIER